MDRLRVEKVIPGRTDARRVFEFVLEVENYALFMPNVNAVSVVEQNGVQRVTRWDTEIEEAPLMWIERDTIEADELRIRFEAIEGDFEVFRGTWEVISKEEGRTHVVCDLEYSIGIKAIEDLVTPILKEKIRENLNIMLQGLIHGLRS